MRRLAILPPACLAILLSACAGSGKPTSPGAALPPLPADIRACFVGVVDVPERALTVGDVERLWKEDRIRSVAMQRCGARLTAFYDDLRRSWR